MPDMTLKIPRQTRGKCDPGPRGGCAGRRILDTGAVSS